MESWNSIPLSPAFFSAAEAAGIAPAEAACSQSDSFRVRVRRGELEDYQVSETAGLTLRGRVNGRIGTASTQALTEESIPLLIQGVLESAALIETDEQDDILPPDNSYASVCNDSEAVTALTAEQKIALAREIDEKLRSDDPRLTPDTCAVATGEETFTLKNTLGLDLSHHSNMIYAMANVVARDGRACRHGLPDPLGLRSGCNRCRNAGRKLQARIADEAGSRAHEERRVSRRHQKQRNGRPARHVLRRVLRR